MSDIEVIVQDKVAMVTLNRPEVRNAMKLSMWQEIASLFAWLGQDPGVRAIILTGAGGNFSVGADISEFEKVRSNIAESKAYEAAVDDSSDAIASAPKPVIAVLEGYCLGGGCHLSMSCDFRYAHTGTSIGIPAAKLSIVYGVRSTQRLLALVGLTNAKRILYSAKRFSANNAERMGLVDYVSADPMTAARALAAEIVKLAPLSVEGAKKILTGLSMGPGALSSKEADAFIDHAAASYDYQEGRLAFVEKRAPIFRGK